jgi:hypothetical protein
MHGKPGESFTAESSTELPESNILLQGHDKWQGICMPELLRQQSSSASIFLDGLYLLNVYMSTGNGNQSSIHILDARRLASQA